MSGKYILNNYRVSELYEKVNSGDTFSMYVLGNKYFYGDEVYEDKDASISWFRKAYKNGSIDGERALGMLSLYGIGQRRDCNTAISLFNSAANNDDMKSMHILGILYMYGECVERDYSKAYMFMKRAYKKGHLLSGFFMFLLSSSPQFGIIKYMFKYIIVIPVLIKWLYYNQRSKLCDNDRLWNLGMFHEIKLFNPLHEIKETYEEEYGPEML